MHLHVPKHMKSEALFVPQNMRVERQHHVEADLFVQTSEHAHNHKYQLPFVTVIILHGQKNSPNQRVQEHL